MWGKVVVFFSDGFGMVDGRRGLVFCYIFYGGVENFLDGFYYFVEVVIFCFFEKCFVVGCV